MTFYSNSERETEAVGSQLAEKLSPGSVVALFGDLGAGKTAFVRGLARGLGLEARVSSPTFTIVNEYLGKTPLFHFDMYRIGGSDELFDIGWDDYLYRGGVCAVEWSENIADALPSDTVRVEISKAGDTSRIIDIRFPEDA
ncbi:MAG: tRNA (adenosine(37)-N6)-threonylcarbamoyltransferase complex ATPase subunit type 1 TsaE [Clostridia bacterium]|nr:tRNA (adenosine(37)-N6)-threonylcarbamoyltransferase complex ATPase subunit type 1 TsaE [Clostridia bacterium]